MTKPQKNDPPLSEDAEPTSFDLDSSMKRHLERMAEESERSLSGMLRFILKQYLEADGK